jgi:hypothetical protein
MNCTLLKSRPKLSALIAIIALCIVASRATADSSGPAALPSTAPGAVTGMGSAPADALPAPQDRPESVLPGRPDEDVPVAGEADQLAERFQSVAAGVSFCPPLGMKEIMRPLSDEIVRYVDDQRHWVLEVTKLELEHPMELGNIKKSDVVVPGLMARTAAGIERATPGAQIYRQDQINVGTVDVGVIVARYQMASETNLTQQAMVRRNGTTYYVFNLTSPAPKDGPVEQDPDVQAAVKTFNQMIDSVRLLDQSQIREDQNQRLYRTRTLFVGLDEARLTGMLKPQQWLRILQDGKDVGYNYVVEEVGNDLPREGEIARELAGPEGILIGIRGRLYPQPGIQADELSWMWMSADRKQEKWSHIARSRRAGSSADLNVVGNIGVVDTTTKYRRDPNLEPGEKTSQGWDANQPAVRPVEVHTLTAKSPYAGSNDATISRDVPVWYIPQALGYILPTVVSGQGTRTYLFASWVPEKQEVMTRYVEVLGERDGELAGKPVHGIVVQDRFGLEGSVNTIYLGKDGSFLGSYNADSKITVLPSDPDSLKKIWKDVNLSRPGAVEQNPDTTIFTRKNPSQEPPPETGTGGPGGGLDSITPQPQQATTPGGQ